MGRQREKNKEVEWEDWCLCSTHRKTTFCDSPVDRAAVGKGHFGLRTYKFPYFICMFPWWDLYGGVLPCQCVVSWLARKAGAGIVCRSIGLVSVILRAPSVSPSLLDAICENHTFFYTPPKTKEKEKKKKKKGTPCLKTRILDQLPGYSS